MSLVSLRSLTRRLAPLHVALALAATACAGAPDDPSSQAEAVRAHELTVGSYVSDAAGFDTRSHWVDTGSEIVVFDAQFTERHAEELVKAIRAGSASPIRFVVITHPNPDKFNGAAVFQRLGAKVVASERVAAAIPGVHAYKRAFFVDVAKMIPADEYPAEATIDLTFSGKLVLPTQSGDVELRELTNPGVSSFQTVGWVPEAKALFVGDLVHHGAHAWLEGGIVAGAPRPDLRAWSSALLELEAFPGATVHGGRGASAPVDLAVAEQRAYLEKAEAIVRSYVEELGPERAELGGAGAGEHHAALAKRFDAEIPGRELVYLIQYGVYGLANAVAAESAGDPG